MAGLVHSIEELVGRTPLMELDRFERQQQCGAHLLAKLEFFNPTGSVKDRAALSMLNAAGGRTVSGHIGSSGIAEAFYGMPSELQQETLKRLPEEMRAAYALFRQNLERRM